LTGLASEGGASVAKGEISPEKLVRMSLLLDTYGPLLTDKQRLFMTLHYEQDLSFGEIAQSHNVSRQAIHDSVKHAESSLEEIESKLKLVDQTLRPDRRRELAERLLNLKQRIRQTGIIYNTEWIQLELAEVVEELVGHAEEIDEVEDASESP